MPPDRLPLIVPPCRHATRCLLIIFAISFADAASYARHFSPPIVFSIS